MSDMIYTEQNSKLPKLFNSLDIEDKISSKWIAKETNKRHGNVLRDIGNISKKLINSNLSQSINIIESTGYNGLEKEYLISLELAIIVLSHYEGKKAEQALALVYEALHYFMNRAPLIESEFFHNDKIVNGLQKKNNKLVISFTGGKNIFLKSIINLLQERISA